MRVRVHRQGRDEATRAAPRPALAVRDVQRTLHAETRAPAAQLAAQRSVGTRRSLGAPRTLRRLRSAEFLNLRVIILRYYSYFLMYPVEIV